MYIACFFYGYERESLEPIFCKDLFFVISLFKKDFFCTKNVLILYKKYAKVRQLKKLLCPF